MGAFRRHYSGVLRPVVARTGVSYDIERSVTVTVRAMVLALPLSCASAIVLGLLVDPALLLVAAAPGAVYAAPGAALRLRVAERRARAEEEAAYFLCYVNIMQTVGHDLYHAFAMLRGGIFRSMERDSREIVKRVRVLGVTRAESLSRYADGHPYGKFREFVDGYLAKTASVGGVPEYTAAKAGFFFGEYTGAWRRYERSAQEIFSGIMMVSIILPMMIMLSAMIGTAGSLGTLMAAGTMISPLISVLMIAALNSAQPATGATLPLPAAAPAAGVLAGAVLYAAGAGAGMALAAALLAASAANAALTWRAARRAASVDAALPEFARDITEMSRTGSNVRSILTEQARRGAYRGHFGSVVSRMAADLRVGVPLEDAVSRTGEASSRFRFLMFLLERTYSTGGGSPAIFSMISEFIGGVHQAQEQVRRSLAPLCAIVYASPLLILGIAHAMSGMMSGGAGAAPGVAFSGGADLGDPSLLGGLELMAASVALPMGFVAAKVSSYTVRNTVPPAITSACTILSMWLAPALVDSLGVF